MGAGGGGQRSRHRRRIERGFCFRSVRLFPDGIALTKRGKTVYTGGPMRQRESDVAVISKERKRRCRYGGEERGAQRRACQFL